MDKILYLGLDPSHCSLHGEIVHYPVLKIEPKTLVDPHILEAFESFTHIVFTSKSAVHIFFSLFKEVSLKGKRFFSVGKITTKTLLQYGVDHIITASRESQEGVIEQLQLEDLSTARLFLPSSAGARSLLRQFLEAKGVPYVYCPLYETKPHMIHPLPDLDDFDAVVFTSPSTVHAFFSSFRTLPSQLKCISQGEVTKKAIVKLYKKDEDTILILKS